MVSIIKNQLLKHLSRFTKNLSADKINLSAFKGEGELTNLELDESVLTDLLELPSWLRLTKALCNRVQFRIHWTKLKSVPIHLILDEVNIIVETCEELRASAPTSGAAAAAAAPLPAKYSFIHKVIDGITVSVNTVNITFNSPAFTASVQILRILVESKSTSWNRSDLRMTRLKDSARDQILIFKEMEWQTVRIEAKSTLDKHLTPLRLLTNQTRCRITIKKRLSDCFIMGSRLVLILDDLLWVLTDSQLKAALHFLDSLAELVQTATELSRKEKAARKLEVLPHQMHRAQQMRTGEDSAISKIFNRFDVVETSYHFVTQRIDLHLCDDPGDGRSCHPRLKNGGALQISLFGFQVDYYPYHLAIGDRKHWPCYHENSVLPHTQWLEQSFNTFRTRFIDLIDKNQKQHSPLTRAMQQQQQQQQQPSLNQSTTSDSVKKSSSTAIKNYVLKQLPKLMTICIVMRINNFTLYKVTTSAEKHSLKEFITAQPKRKEKSAGDRQFLTSFPSETNILHAEFTYYYYPGDIPFPLPAPKFYVQMNPIQIYFDIESCLWLNSFIMNLHQSLIEMKSNAGDASLPYIDVKIEAILPKVIIESSSDYHGQRDRPKSLHIQVTRATITNVRSLEHSSRADLAKCVDSFHMGSLFFGSEFPSQPNDFYIVTEKFLNHIAAEDHVRPVPEFHPNRPVEEQFHNNQSLLWTEAKDVWCVTLDPVWADFYGARSVGSNRPIPLLDAVPLTIWAHFNQPSASNMADIHALFNISNLVSVQLNHYQFLFLLRVAEQLSEFTTFLAIDSNRILKNGATKSFAIGALVPQIEVTFVMPSQCPEGKESSGGDLESVLPDSSSIADDILPATGSGTTLWQQTELLNDCAKKSVTQTLNVDFNQSVICVDNDDTSHKSMVVINNNNKQQMNNNTSPFSYIPNNVVSGFPGLSSMKKSLNSLKTSFDSALKPSPDDLSDTISIQSDVSSDTENFIVVNMNVEDDDGGGGGGDKNGGSCLEAMFKVQQQSSSVFDNATTVKVVTDVELASEVIEDENSVVTTPSEHSLASTYKRRDLISIVTFKLSQVEFLEQSSGLTTSLKLQVSNISSDECGSIPWDEFQSKFSSRSKVWADLESNCNRTPIVKLRFDHEMLLPSISSSVIIDRNNFKKLSKNMLNIKLNDVKLSLNMSTVVGLADLTEDEIIPIPIPLQISLNNIQIHLTEDRPPNNITSPGSIAKDVNKDSDVEAFQQTIKQLKLDNDELKRRLTAFERISEENCSLRKSKEESEILRACLTSAQDDIAKLIDDKRTLLEHLQRLEGRLKQNDRWTSKR